MPLDVKHTPLPSVVWKRQNSLFKCWVKELLRVGIPKPPMRATSGDSAPMRLKAMTIANEVVSGVRRNETMARNRMTAWANLFALRFCEQIWAKTRSDSIEDMLVIG